MPMAATLHLALLAFSSALLAASASASASSSSLPPAVFKVGDERGWAVPANGTETYNHWAKRNRIKVGDVLSFRYANDSVLLVSHDDYKQCSTEAPLSRFTGGDTKFTLDRSGPVYFLSGVAGHCEAGQRMIVRAKAPSSLYGAPAAAPAGMPPAVSGGGAGGAPTPVASAPAVPSVGSGSGFGSGSTSPTPSPSPSPVPAASGASTRRVLGVVSSVAVGIVVSVAICAITLSVVV